VIVLGSPLNLEDLKRANICYASKAVIMGEDPQMKSANFEMQDAQTIFMYKLIKKCNPDIEVVLELIDKNNIKYLNDFQSINESEALFASGEVYVSTYLDGLLCQLYYNPHILAIIDKLLIFENESTNIMSLFDDLQ